MSSNMIPLGLNLITHGFDKMSHGFDKIPHHLDNFQQGLDGFPYCCNVSLLLKNIQLYIVACLTDSWLFVSFRWKVSSVGLIYNVRSVQNV